MKKTDIEKAANDFVEMLSDRPYAEDVARFAVKQVNEVLQEAEDIADEHRCQTYSELCDCGNHIKKDIRALKISE